MKICLLASGSKGNCTYLETANNKILIDIGITCLSVEKHLEKLNVNPSKIDSVFITHTHSDHINGLASFCKKYNPKIFMSEKMYIQIQDKIDIKNYELIEREYIINDLSIFVVKTSHDIDDSNGYIFENDNKSVVYITDTGYINAKYYEKLKNKQLYVIESNHDVELLMNSARPYHLKQRILGVKGHLSNNDSAYYISQFAGNKTNCVILAHLSEDNNTAELATTVLNKTLTDYKKNIDKVIIAQQYEPTELIEV